MINKTNSNLIYKFVVSSNEDLLKQLEYNKNGLNKKEVEINRNKYGKNNSLNFKKDTFLYRLKRSFINPYSVVLFILAIISFFADIIFTKNKNYTTVIIILLMLLISGLVRFFQELKAKKITDELVNIINCNFTVNRNNEMTLIKYDEIVVGDIISLQAGEIVPADIRLLSADNLFVSESIITGESEIYEKNANPLTTKPKKITDFTNTLFQGSSIISGKCKGIVLGVGKNTIYGDLNLDDIHKKGFDHGTNSIVWVLIKFMCILVPIVFIASGLTKGNWLQAFLFALSVAVGLTPELLPMVITACLAKGSYNMRKKETIVKNINAMEEFGSMDVLCVDKTGTLTQDKLVLEYYMDIIGNEDNKTLNLAYLNSFNSSSFVNPLDKAILKVKDQSNNKNIYTTLENSYQKLDEFPFDYDRKISSVLVKNKTGNNLLISKGPVDDIVNRCKFILYKDQINLIEQDAIANAHEIVDEMLEDGMKVLAIAVKDTKDNIITDSLEQDLILVGFIAFFDSPKQSAYSVLNKLNELNITVKVLTGDNKNITASICKRLGMDISNIITGSQLDEYSDDEIQLIIENNKIFAELTPKQKSNIITMLQVNGHKVGFLGDGINDMKAMLKADVSISVENAAPSLKDIADVILLKKDLNVLEQGVIEGRKAFNNMSKYVRITASSNLGNIMAIVLASIFLPFFPITSIQILLLNLLYDILCLAIPWDNVDKELCNKPLVWSSNKLSKFMLTFGITSSIFDVITFLFLLLYLCPALAGGPYNTLDTESKLKFVSIFQTGWFLESMWTQVLIIHLLRTDKLPFIQSKPSILLFIVTIFGILIFTLVTMTPLGTLIGLTTMPFIYFVFLIATVICYLLIISVIKKIYIKANKTLM